MNLDPVLLEILVCPDCKGSLTVDQDHDELVCNSCGLVYPVRDNIPIMLVEEARRPKSLGSADEADDLSPAPPESAAESTAQTGDTSDA